MEEYSLRSQVFQTIRDDILKGKYEENDEQGSNIGEGTWS